MRLLTDPAYNLVEPERKRPMFKVHFSTDNSAFTGIEALETARILKEIAKKLEQGKLEGVVLDDNGNSIGVYALK